MLFDLINLNKLRRGLLYALLLLLTVLVQNLILSRVGFWGIRALIVPAAVVGVALFEGGVWGGGFGLCAGLVTDLCFPDTVVLFTIVFTIIGFFVGMLAQFVLNRRFFPFLCACIAALILTAAFQLFPLLVAGGDLTSLLTVAGLQILLSLPVSLLLYPPCRALSRR